MGKLYMTREPDKKLLKMEKRRLKFLAQYAERLYLGEKERESTILNQSSSLLMGQSIYISAIFLIYVSMEKYSYFFLISLGLSMVSLICNVLVQVRMKVEFYPKYEEMANLDYSNEEDWCSEQADDFYASKYKEMSDSISDNNNKRVRLLGLSMVLYVVGVSTLICSILADIIERGLL